ncbi:MAG: SRPBCC family protein [Solirubrobacterales bacterium]|nr:SRPBCC family protein [Solirubrobacterales bacterium]
MRAARRSRTVPAAVDDVWRTVADPRHLARWWPRVQRVEGAHGDAFTEVLRSDKGATVRADFTVVERRSPERIVWRQEVEGSPFERLLAASETTVALEPADGGTRVELRLAQKLKGIARFGGFLVRRAATRQLDDALAGLDRLHGGGGA